MNPLGNLKHGYHGSLTYGRWKAMRQRTSKRRSRHHREYYGGVECCARWSSFTFFLADMGECPAGHTLDRIDNARGYEPGNCRWATKAAQNENRSSTVFLKLDGATNSVAGWAKRLGISANTIRARLKQGWTTERTLTEPVGARGGARGTKAAVRGKDYRA